MVLLGLFVTAWVVSLSGALMPGPLATVTVNESLRRGAWVGPLLIAGHGILEILLVVALLLGLRAVLALPPVEFWLSLVGSLVLGYLAWGLLRAPAGPPAAPETGDVAGGGGARKWLRLVWAGVAVSAANPYWELWWASIGAAMLFQARATAGGAGVAAFCSGHLLGDLCWYTLLSVGVASGRRWLGRAAYRGVTTACGLFLFALGAYFFYHAVRVGSGIWG